MDIAAVDPTLEINPEGVRVVLQGFKVFTLLANQIMIAEGVGKDDGDGNLVLPEGAWLNLRNYLNSLKRVGREVGDQPLFEGGQSVPRLAVFPPHIKDIHSALASVDVAYHMNHRRKDGQTLFDPTTGTMQEGIGHYAYKNFPGQQKAEVVSDTPYPCAYDRGIILAMAKRFEPTAAVAHGSTCRKRGNPSCTYIVTWT